MKKTRLSGTIAVLTLLNFSSAWAQADTGWFGICKCGGVRPITQISEPKYPTKELCKLVDGARCDAICLNANTHESAEQLFRKIIEAVSPQAGTRASTPRLNAFHEGNLFNDSTRTARAAHDCYPRSKHDGKLPKDELAKKLMPQPQFEPVIKMQSAPADALRVDPLAVPQASVGSVPLQDFTRDVQSLLKDPRAPKIAVAAVTAVAVLYAAIKVTEAAVSGGALALEPISTSVAVAAVGLIAQKSGIPTRVPMDDLDGISEAYDLSLSSFEQQGSDFSGSFEMLGQSVDFRVVGEKVTVEQGDRSGDTTCEIGAQDQSPKCGTR